MTKLNHSHNKNKETIICLYCGNNPINHTTALIDSYIFSILSPVALWFIATWPGRVLVKLMDSFFKVFILVLDKFNLAQFASNFHDFDSDRGIVLGEEALKRGYKFEILKLFGIFHDTYKVTFPDGKNLIFDGLPRPDKVNVLLSAWMDDKFLTKKRLLKYNIPTPKGFSVRSWRQTSAAYDALTKPIIIKPRSGSRGRHTTTNINTKEELKTAFYRAKQLGYRVIVEEHYFGSVYRATCVDGKLAGVLAGDPPRVIGDGILTVSQLIETKNNNRPDRVETVTLTSKHVEFLTNQNISLDTVLPPGAIIDISEKIGLSYGGASREVTADVHPKLRSLLEVAAAAMGDPLLGFDFITTSVELDPDTQRWGIIECNSVPFINLHHDPLVGAPVNVAAKVWDWVEDEMKVSNNK